MWWNDVNLEGLSKSVEHTKWPSALAYDEMNINVEGWVIMKSKCAKVNECGDNMIWSYCKRWEQYQMSLSNLWERKVNEETSLNEHSNESIEINVYLILMMRGEIIYLAMMSSY